MTGPVTWELYGMQHEVERVKLRNSRYVALDADEDVLYVKDIQVGDVIVLWAGDSWDPRADGIAAQVQHVEWLCDHKDRPQWIVYQIGEPFAARAVAGGDEDDGGD